MIERLGCTYAPPSRLNAMAFITSQSFAPVVLCMTEADAKCRRRLRSANIAFHLMACATRGNVAPVCLRACRVTSITVVMRIEPPRDRERNSTTQRPVTTRTTQAAQVPVPRMFEAHSKTRKPRKRLQRTRLCVCMTDRANLMSCVCKLLRMTTGTRCMVRSARHRWSRSIRFSSMAQQARQSRVILVIMPEL